MNRVSKKKLFIFTAIFIVVMGGIALILFNNNKAMILFNELFPSKSIEAINLTEEQKISDFEQMYKTIISGYPNLSDINDIYSIDFIERKPYYLELIKNTRNDFQYYCTISAIMQDLSSFHSDLCFPDYRQICYTRGYNQDNVLAERNLIPYTIYWNKLIEKYCKDYNYVGIAEFKYINGEYTFDLKWSSEKYHDLLSYSICSIDGISIDEYVVENVSIYRTQYDNENNKAYKRVVTLNDAIGDKHSVILKNEAGETITRELCTSLEMEVVNTYSYKFNSDENVPSTPSIYDYYDGDPNILYVAINDFDNNEGERLKSIFSKANSETKIIIDLRENYGGYTGYAADYIYPFLYEDDVVFEQKWEVPSSKMNDMLNKDFIIQSRYTAEKTDNGTIYHSQTHYEGGDMDYRENLYYLIGDKTASAADEYVAMIKENHLGTIIGTNTAGEGLGGSFFVCMTQNSGLVYLYYPCQAYNSDGTNNAIYGTEPDVYISQSKDSFIKQREMEKNGENIEAYDSRMIWDNILNEVVSQVIG